jgi:hypothetical protein
MGSVHARGDTFLTFGLKALTETNTSRLATDAYLPHWLNVNGINFSKFGRAEVECSVFMLHILLEGNIKRTQNAASDKGSAPKAQGRTEWNYKHLQKMFLGPDYYLVTFIKRIIADELFKS